MPELVSAYTPYDCLFLCSVNPACGVVTFAGNANFTMVRRPTDAELHFALTVRHY
jgi:hypothetical protein